MAENAPDFNDILARIREEEDNQDEFLSEPETSTPTDDTLNDYVLKKGSKLLESNIDLIDRIKNRIATAHDPDEIAALTNLFKSSNAILTTLTSISIQNKKDKLTRELTTQKVKTALPTTVNNTLFVGTREEMLKMLEKDVTSDVDKISNPPYADSEK